MKILFDQNLPHNMRGLLPGMAGHQIFTAGVLG